MRLSRRLLALAGIHGAIAVGVEVENHFLYAGAGGSARFLSRLPFTAIEDAAVALAVAAICLTLVRLGGRPAAWLGGGLISAANLYVIADQVPFGLFLDHARLSSAEGHTPPLALFLDSYLAEAPWTLPMNLALLFIPSLLAIRRALAARSGPPVRVPALLVLAYLAVAGVVVQGGLDPVEQHPLATLAGDALFPPRRPLRRAAPHPPVDRPLYGPAVPDPADAARLAAALAAIRSRPLRPNVVLVVLESVGAKQLLTDGLPTKGVTPFLASLSRHAVVFDAIYTSFPGTVRAHVALELGGRTLTYGSVYDELSARFTGPTLVEAMRGLGYRTGCFDAAGDLANENMDTFYRGLGWDELRHFGNATPEFRAKNALNSWGGREDAFARLALEWIDRGAERPFFLAFMTNSTHHPYGAPGGPPGRSNRRRYLDALRDTDAVLGSLVAEIEARRLPNDTIVLVTGDHGEAFGDVHPGNLLHRNRLYEENVRTFLIVADPKRLDGPIVSHRIGAMGDVMPTLISLLGGEVPVPDVPGRPLLGPGWTPTIVYFHKSVHPESWGLRDGRWKYVATIDGAKRSLYDLETDPDEQRDVARSHREMVQAYDDLDAAWYTETNDDFLDHLEGFRLAGKTGGPRLDARALRTPGPKIIRFGEQDAGGGFAEARPIDPCRPVVAWTQWVSWGRDKTIRYQWVAPGGRSYDYDFRVSSEWTRTRYQPRLPLPLEPGRWRLILWDGPERLLSRAFDVPPLAAARCAT